MGNNVTDKLAELEKRTAVIAVEVNERQKALDEEHEKIFDLVDKLGKILFSTINFVIML